ncbi:phosphatase PAP2 family protein [Actinomadura harenae]|uniref:Phosphatase PAP2 family protein n=1 Tax=Actinomadura harenae TaxID=2483351 RepID=A0A3M2LR58_9ACTN|nr:phosphatase PAP2 family protein [Actinomadura harenae]RMI39772.1 phosphatase PAP2 family protein [Actinomadura harenae]
MAQTAPAAPRGQTEETAAPTGHVPLPRQGSADDDHRPSGLAPRFARLARVARAVRTYSGSVHAPPLWRELALIALFYTAYTLTRIILVQDGTGPAFQHAKDILSLERTLGVDVELDLNRWLLDVTWLAKAANIFYASMHFVVTTALVVWLYRYRPQEYRWLRAAVMIATGLALIGFWLYPLAPPRFLGSAGFVDPVTALHSWGLYSGDSTGTMTNQYAAMPSMHAGWSLWCGFVLVRLGTQRWVKALGVAYPVTTVLVILSTANHYILDAVIGIGLIIGSLALSWLFYRRTPQPLQRARERVGSRVRTGRTKVMVRIRTVAGTRSAERV